MSSRKQLAFELMNETKKQNARVDRARGLLALISDYDDSLKRKIAELNNLDSDLDEEEKESARTLIAMMKKKKSDEIRTLESST